MEKFQISFKLNLTKDSNLSFIIISTNIQFYLFESIW